MKNNSSLSGNVGIQVVAAILSVIAIILGIVAINAGNNSKKAVVDLQAKIENDMASVAAVENDIRQLKMQTQGAVTQLATEINTLRDQMTKKPEPKEDVKKGDGKATEAATPAGPGTTHTIKSGDTYGKLAKQYGTSTAAIEKLNPNVSAKSLKIGQKIRVK